MKIHPYWNEWEHYSSRKFGKKTLNKYDDDASNEDFYLVDV